MLPLLSSLAAAAVMAGVSVDPAVVQRTAAEVVRGLEADDYAAFVGARDVPTSADFLPFSELIELHDCFEIERYEVGPADEARTAIVTIEGSAVTRGLRRPVALPKRLLLRFDERGRLERIDTPERVLGLAMKLAKNDEERDRLLAAHPELDRRRVLRELALRAAYGFDTGSSPDAARYAVRGARSLGDRELESHALGLLSTAILVSAPGSGLPAAEESLDVAVAHGSADAVATAIFKVGIARWFDRDFTGAVDALSACGRLIDQLDDPRTALKSIYMASYVSQNAGDFRGALLAAQELVPLASRYGWQEGEGNASFLLGNIQNVLRNREAAIAHYRRAGAMALARRHLDTYADAVASIAECELRHGNVAAAEKVLATTVELPAIGMSNIGLMWRQGDVLAQRGRLDEAEHQLACVRLYARQTGLHRLVADIDVMRSVIARRRGDPERALDLTARDPAEQRVFDTIVMFWSPWHVYAAMGAALRDLGERQLAISALQSAVALIEETRDSAQVGALGRVAYFEDRVQPYVDLVELLVADGRDEEALAVAERIKARALRETLEQGRGDVRAVMTNAERDEERALEAELLQWNVAAAAARLRGPVPAPIEEKLARARSRLDDFTSRLHIAHPSLRPVSVTASDGAPPALDRRTIGVQYVVGPRQTTLFVLRAAHTGRTIVETHTVAVTRDELRASVNRLVQAIEQRDLGYAAPARALYDLLVAPYARHLAAGRTLTVVPDDALWRAPFHVLRSASGQSLLERVTVAYAPSMSMRRAASRRARPRMVVAFGNPSLKQATVERVRATYRDAELGDLPEAAEEARAVARMYGAEASVYTGSEALESRLKECAAEARVIHIATHGFLDRSAPMYSALSLATRPQDAEDGLLEAREILALPLAADLAVLSACESAGGRVGAGEGMIGLPWAFLAAGCRTTIVSQWKVESIAASRLMVELHRRYRRGATPAAALRAAQLALARDPRYRHPFYWAAFSVVGGM